jgi:hypothetical protein
MDAVPMSQDIFEGVPLGVMVTILILLVALAVAVASVLWVPKKKQERVVQEN